MTCWSASEVDVSLIIYNLLGQTVTELINGRLPAGEEIVIWSVKDIAMGVYFVKLTTGTEAVTQKIVVLKWDPVPGWWNR